MSRRRLTALGERGAAGWFCEAELVGEDRLVGDLYSRYRPGGVVTREKSFSVQRRGDGSFVVAVGPNGNSIKFRWNVPHPAGPPRVIPSVTVREGKTYRVTARDYRTAIGVFHNPGLFDPRELKIAEAIIRNHDEGATFSARPRVYRPRTRRNRGLK